MRAKDFVRYILRSQGSIIPPCTNDLGSCLGFLLGLLAASEVLYSYSLSRTIFVKASPLAMTSRDIATPSAKAKGRSTGVGLFGDSLLGDKVVEEEENDNDSSSSTAWEVSFSLYFPLIFMWVKHCMMGTANVLHSLIAGHCLRLFVENFSEWTPAWLHSMVLHPSANGKTDHRAWPPPALVMLASLTLFALVVHPDGFTWILLGKIRDVIGSVYYSTISTFGIAVQDYGIIPTLAASSTLATLMFLIFIILKTLSPRTPKRTSALPEKKKKKRNRGHARHRGGGGGARIKEREKPTVSSKHDEKKSFGNTTKMNAADQTPYLEAGVPSSLDENEKATTLDMTNEKSNIKRNRISSVSTIDTTTLSADDQSCGSVPSTNAITSSRSIGTGDQETTTQVEKWKSLAATSNLRENQGSGKPSSKLDHPNFHKNNGKSTSRWDALKPNQQTVNKYHQNQYTQSNGNHQNNSKKRAGGIGQKKGRQQPPHSRSAPNKSGALPRSSFQSGKTMTQANPSRLAKLPPPPPPPPPGLGPFPQGTTSLQQSDSGIGSWINHTIPSESVDWQGVTRPAVVQNLAIGGVSVPFDRPFDAPQQARNFSSHQGANKSYGSITVKDNPFANDTVSDSQIEAELQELGCHMAGSILDF